MLSVANRTMRVLAVETGPRRKLSRKPCRLPRHSTNLSPPCPKPFRRCALSAEASGLQVAGARKLLAEASAGSCLFILA